MKKNAKNSIPRKIKAYVVVNKTTNKYSAYDVYGEKPELTKDEVLWEVQICPVSLVKVKK